MHLNLAHRFIRIHLLSIWTSKDKIGAIRYLLEAEPLEFKKEKFSFSHTVDILSNSFKEKSKKLTKKSLLHR